LKGVDLSVQEETAAPALASFVAGGGTTVSQEVEDTTPINVTPQAVDVVLPEMLVASQEKAQERLSEEVEAPANISENGDKDGKADKKAKVLTPSQKIKKRNFWLQVAAWAVALVVLLSALLYYNVFDKEKSVTVYSVGDRLPDFVLDTYDSVGAYDKDGNRMETFSSMENKGTVMVINFWYTTCDPCVGELPYFEKVRQEFGDQIIMIAIHDVQIIDDVQTFLETVDESKNKDDWSQYGIIFAQDTEEYDCFEMLGGKSAFPITVVVDTDGKIAYYNPGTVEENELRSQIQSVLK
jgi:thiol-disulfide isomerase/thioredoxin